MDNPFISRAVIEAIAGVQLVAGAFLGEAVDADLAGADEVLGLSAGLRQSGKLDGLRYVWGLRREGFDGTLTLIGAEQHPPYERPPLSKSFLRGETPFEEALVLANRMIAEFWDDEDGGFFHTGKSHEKLIVRSKDYFDNATPSGNSVAAEALLRLGLLTDNGDYTKRAITILRQLAESAHSYPAGFGRALCALDFYLARPKEIAIIGDSRFDQTESLMKEVWKQYLPNKVIAHALPDESGASNLIPLLQNRPLLNNAPTAYVCENHVCLEPVTDPQRLASLLYEQSVAGGKSAD